jgi:4-carboxymuconolactone decarboxylase
LNKKTYDEGMAVRREVLGADYVDRTMASADPFTRVLYDFATEWCWGAVWTRPGLTRKTRSLLNLAEVFLQAGVYAGVPAAVDAFRAAKEVFDSLDQK